MKDSLFLTSLTLLAFAPIVENIRLIFGIIAILTYIIYLINANKMNKLTVEILNNMNDKLKDITSKHSDKSDTKSEHTNK